MSAQNKKQNKRRRTANKEGGTTLTATCKSVLRSLPVTLGAGVLLLLFATALLLMTKDPNRYLRAGGMAVLYLTALLGGFIATKWNHRRSPALCGALAGGLMLLLFSLLALILPSGRESEMGGGMALLLRAAMLPAALLGALFAAREKHNKPHKHAHRH